VAHLAHGEAQNDVHSDVDGKKVPVRHFGIVLSMSECEAMADKLKKAGTQFVIEPYIRFKGEVGEQATMFFLDPSGNAIEFKAMAHPDRLFAK
jgi:extradiol dioxygenase family protein